MANQGTREFAVIGLGRFGSAVAEELMLRGHTVLGIDSDPDLVQQYADRLTHTVALDATIEDALRAVDITAFDTVIVAIGNNFESSVLVTVALKQLGASKVVCKASSDRQAEVLRRIGADRVVLPEVEIAQRLAKEISTPRLLDEMPMSPGYSIAEVHVPASLAGKKLGDSKMRKDFNLLVLLVRNDHSTIVAPPPSYTFEEHDMMVVLGADEAIEQIALDL